MKVRTVAAALLVAASLPGVSAAHIASGHGSKQHQLEVRIAHDRGVVAAVDRQAREAGSAMYIEWSQWLTRQWHARDLVVALTQLEAMSRPAHYYGWLCIHSREGSWTSQTGNGFYGGLQMTYGWMGLVVNAALLSPLQQMQAAEEGYRRSGYSHAWLAGQWPNTYPPCTRYF